ncbi:MAG: Gldg family protein [Pseudohongiellaceae bacterium]
MIRKQLFSASGLVLTAIALLFIVAVISVFPRLRIDLTQDNLYTLADGTREILSDLDRPVELLFFYSEQGAADTPQIRAYGDRVQELLREMVIASNGNLSLEVIDPEPFSVDEDLATEYGVRAVPLTQGGQEIFFGLVARDPSTVSDEGEESGTEPVYESMPLIRPDQEQFLEYEFSRLITRVEEPEPTVVGFLSSLDIDGGFNPQTQQATPPWSIMENIRYLYDTQRIPSDVTMIDEEIDVLMVVHPQDLGNQARYAVEQFVLGGGRALMFVDPNSDMQTQLMLNRQGDFEDTSSELAPLLESWGVRYDPEQVVADRERALMISLGQGTRPISHIGMMGIQRDGMYSDLTTAELQILNLASPGALQPIEDSGMEFEPLLRSSRDSGLMDNTWYYDLTDPTILLDEFEADDQRHVLAARITGIAESAFPNGPPVLDPEEPRAFDLVFDEEEDTAELVDPLEENAPELPEQITRSENPINVIVVADSDLLTDRLWAQSREVLGERVTQAFANNGDFVINALDNLSGSEELISIRARGSYARPFTRVLEMQREADERLRQEETNLLNRLSETEQQIAALTQEGDGSGGPTAQQQAEIDRFMQEQLETRRRLREVRFQLNEDIEQLGARLQLINTALVPVLLIIGALVAGYLRRRKRQQASR